MAKLLGMHVTVLEDRCEYAELAQEAGADVVICKPFQEGIRMLPDNENAWYLVMTRAHKMDQDCLEVIFEKPYTYVGMLGSARKVETICGNLSEKGIAKEHFERLHSPVGIEIGAKSQSEIAVSVMAEMIQIRNSEERGKTAFDRELLGREALHPAPGILCTLIDNGGGSPREIGTKMMVYSEQNRVGTIGGGVLEGSVIREAIKMMEEDANRKLIHTGVDGKLDGLVCTGYSTVLLEKF